MPSKLLFAIFYRNWNKFWIFG